MTPPGPQEPGVSRGVPSTVAGERLLDGLRDYDNLPPDRIGFLSAAIARVESEARQQGWGRDQDVLRAVTSRVDCGHGHIDVRHVAPFHFDGPACAHCSDAEYADRMQRLDPCVICAALGASETQQGTR